MPVHDFKAQRLFLEDDLAEKVEVACDRSRANYLVNVLRMKAGDRILVFNGRDGEWSAEIAEVAKRACTLRLTAQVRPQLQGPDLTYWFAPLKRARLDYMVQKATELGVARLQPVLTRYTIAERVNTERMRSNVIEAAEQCGILRIPEVCSPVSLSAALAGRPAGEPLIFCDEAAEIAAPIAALSTLPPGQPVIVLIGPEGGFADDERAALLAGNGVLRLSLGPRIMRADTAAIAALSLVNATLGDWRT